MGVKYLKCGGKSCSCLVSDVKRLEMKNNVALPVMMVVMGGGGSFGTDEQWRRKNQINQSGKLTSLIFHTLDIESAAAASLNY